MNQLRRRFILAAMLSLFAVLAAIVVGMNMLNYIDVIGSADRTIDMIEENGGTFPKPFGFATRGAVSSAAADRANPPAKPSGDPGDRPIGSFPPIGNNNGAPQGGKWDFSAEAPYETRYFTVFIRDGQIRETHMDNIAAVTQEQAEELAKTVLEEGDEEGFDNDGIYRYRVVKDSMIIFLNCEKRLDTFSSTLLISSLVSLAGLLVVFLLVVITSKIVFKPVAESEKKQKQFLTDASHELKTPLAIIEANTEVMELESGETKWTKSTKHQIKRLTGLVEQMVALTRLDESGPDGEAAPIDLSEILWEMTDTYQAPAEVAGKTIHMDITDGIRIHGNEKNIRQLIGILLDNAVKYATEDTGIQVKLTARGRRAILTVYNVATGLTQGDNAMLFERFYRADASRNSETGGTGIGLSVARSIVEKAKGRITAFSEDGESLEITVYLPLAG